MTHFYLNRRSHAQLKEEMELKAWNQKEMIRYVDAIARQCPSGVVFIDADCPATVAAVVADYGSRLGLRIYVEGTDEAGVRMPISLHGPSNRRPDDD